MPIDTRSFVMFGGQPPQAPAMQRSPMQAQPKPTSIYIPDTRKVDAVTGKVVSDKNGLSRRADIDAMTQIIRSAKKNGVDPYTALAIAHQETGLAPIGDTEGNPFHLLDNTSDDLVEAGVKTLKDKLQYGRQLGKKTEPELIQAFNGYGKVGRHTEGLHRMMYGIDVSQTPIDMGKNPVYGKRIIDIRDNILKKNPEIAKLVENL